jgi:hypothetical protein
MTFPTGTQITTTNLLTADSDPSLARVDLLALAQALNQLIASENIAQGVLTLDGGGRVSTAFLPSSITVPGNLVLQPASKIVTVQDVLRLTQRYTADNALLTSPAAGDMIYLIDGDGGRPCLAVYDAANWRVVRFMTIVGSAAAALTSTATLTATAD